jgi:NAD(P)-dependent dehydrogenase (short-subunit alcohol dehydrogenase family)
MSEVWCIVSEDNVGGRALAEALLEESQEVAVLSRDVEPFALLVNSYADSIVPAELRHADLLDLAEALTCIEQSFATVDVVALVGADDERMHAAGDLLLARWPEAELVIVSAARPLAAVPA